LRENGPLGTHKIITKYFQILWWIKYSDKKLHSYNFFHAFGCHFGLETLKNYFQRVDWMKCFAG
jgi:hypothetical protein